MKKNYLFTFMILSIWVLNSCSKEKRTFNKLEGTWKIEKIEQLNVFYDSIMQLPSGGTFTFNNCSYNDNSTNQNNCSCSYKFNENNEELTAYYQFQSGDISFQKTGYGISIFNGYSNSKDSLNFYQIVNGGEIHEISDTKLVFEIGLSYTVNAKMDKVLLYCVKE